MKGQQQQLQQQKLLLNMKLPRKPLEVGQKEAQNYNLASTVILEDNDIEEFQASQTAANII